MQSVGSCIPKLYFSKEKIDLLITFNNTSLYSRRLFLKDSKQKNKILRAFTISIIIVALYYLVLYLSGAVSKGALILAASSFLLSLYFDPDYRFFRIGLITLGLYGINAFTLAFKFSINSESFLFDLVTTPDSSPNVLFLVISGLCFILDLFRENGLSHQFNTIIGSGNTINNTSFINRCFFSLVL